MPIRGSNRLHLLTWDPGLDLLALALCRDLDLPAVTTTLLVSQDHWGPQPFHRDPGGDELFAGHLTSREDLSEG